MSTEVKPIVESDVNNMKFHEVLEVHTSPYFRIMRVKNGWLYNFYDEDKDTYQKEWVFVPIISIL